MVQAGFEPATLALLNATPTFEVGVAISILKSISTTLYQLSYRTALRSNSEARINRAELQDLCVVQ